jgi:hypothetical protein
VGGASGGAPSGLRPPLAAWSPCLDFNFSAARLLQRPQCSTSQQYPALDLLLQKRGDRPCPPWRDRPCPAWHLAYGAGVPRATPQDGVAAFRAFQDNAANTTADDQESNATTTTDSNEGGRRGQERSTDERKGIPERILDELTGGRTQEEHKEDRSRSRPPPIDLSAFTDPGSPRRQRRATQMTPQTLQTLHQLQSDTPVTQTDGQAQCTPRSPDPFGSIMTEDSVDLSEELESSEGDRQSRQAAENPGQRLRSLDMEGSFMLVP